jgi:Tol biopolymer transport system component
MSTDTKGTQVATGGAAGITLSGDGRYLAFSSPAYNLVESDTNGAADMFVRDRQTGDLIRVSVNSAGVQGNANSASGMISAAGRYVAFVSSATNLVAGDTNGTADLFVHDLQTGQTTRVNLGSTGQQSNGSLPASTSISADGRYITWNTNSTNLVPADTTPDTDVYVRDTVAGTTALVSVSSAGVKGNGDSSAPSISADGRYITFSSLAGNLVAGDTNGTSDLFLHDMQTGQTMRVNVNNNGDQAVGAQPTTAALSADGRYVVWSSVATNLVAGDTNASRDVFRRDLVSGVTTRVNVTPAGGQSAGDLAAFTIRVTVSADGRYVSFNSAATDLVAGDTNNTADAFVRDMVAGQTTRVNVGNAGEQSNGTATAQAPVMSDDGRYVAWSSNATNLVAVDQNGTLSDVFLRRLL